jgi:hypothetical protein
MGYWRKAVATVEDSGNYWLFKTDGRGRSPSDFAATKRVGSEVLGMIEGSQYNWHHPYETLSSGYIYNHVSAKTLHEQTLFARVSLEKLAQHLPIDLYGDNVWNHAVAPESHMNFLKRLDSYLQNDCGLQGQLFILGSGYKNGEKTKWWFDIKDSSICFVPGTKNAAMLYKLYSFEAIVDNLINEVIALPS